MNKISKSAFAVMLAAVVSSPIHAQTPAPNQTIIAPPAQVGVNLLSNPSHEHPGVYFAGRGEINVTWNWVPFWQEAPPGVDARDQNYRTPEFRPPFARDYPYRVNSGGGSDRWFNYFALNKNAGILQEVEGLTVGQPIRFSTWVELWSSADNDTLHVPPLSTRDGNMQVRVCIDQDGGVRNMLDLEMKCSPWYQTYDKWYQISVDAVAKATKVTALIHTRAAIAVEHNDAYADDSCFEILSAPGAQGVCLGNGFVQTGMSNGIAQISDPPPLANVSSDDETIAQSSGYVAISSTASTSGTVPSTAAPTAAGAPAQGPAPTPAYSAAAAAPAQGPAPTPAYSAPAPAAAPAQASAPSAPAAAASGQSNWVVRAKVPVLNVRNGPGMSATILGQLSPSSVAEYVTDSGEWRQVKFQGQTGFVFSALCSVVERDAPVAAAAPAPMIAAPVAAPIVSVAAPEGTAPKLAGNVAAGLNVRVEPSIGGDVMGIVQQGQTLDVIGKSTDGMWYQVMFGNKQAWVYAALTMPNAAAQAFR